MSANDESHVVDGPVNSQAEESGSPPQYTPPPLGALPTSQNRTPETETHTPRTTARMLVNVKAAPQILVFCEQSRAGVSAWGREAVRWLGYNVRTAPNFSPITSPLTSIHDAEVC